VTIHEILDFDFEEPTTKHASLRVDQCGRDGFGFCHHAYLVDPWIPRYGDFREDE
jgi:hypothetical protein